MTDKLKSTRDRKGWLVPYLLTLDQMFFKRWDYWYRALENDTIPDDPIPYIPFRTPQSYPEQLVKKNLKQCLNYAVYGTSNTFEAFIDWILWGFNQGKEFPRISEKIDDYWYRTFNLGLFYTEPADHLADLVPEYSGHHGGYFPTPANVVHMMVQMTFGGEPKQEHKRMSVGDPCSGSGIMLLYASNYSLNLYGMDINPLICQVALVNAFIYVPWLAYRPKHLALFDRDQQGIMEVELPTGIRIPKCRSCDGKSLFIMDIETDHIVVLNNGLLTVNQPTLSTDLIAKRLKPENITCAECFRKLKKEAVV